MLNTIRPRVLDGSSALGDVLYRNEGMDAVGKHPVFTNNTRQAGIADDGHGLGIAISDINSDGYPDVYVANDYIANDELWLNNRDGSFFNCIATAIRHQSYSSNGVTEPIFCYYIKNNQGQYEENAGISRDQWASQMPSIKKRYDMNQTYASAGIGQILGPEQMNGATILTCNEVRSGYFENDGKGKFIFHAFPTEAQFAPVNAILTADTDKDGKKDILLAGNEYEYNVAVGRMDASYGVWLKANGQNQFSSMPAVQSGWISDGDIRDMKWISTKAGARLLMLAKNDGALQILQVKN